MSFKISPLAVAQSYGEVSQVNPLRWVMLFRTGDKSFECQTGDIKCKDFFNDTLAYFKEGGEFNMYGYTSKKKKNDEGVYFLLKNIDHSVTFANNIDVLNAKLKEQLGCIIALWPHGKDFIALLPNEVWESTWKLSLVTMLIRCCNYGYKYEKWDDFYRTDAPMCQQDRAFDQRAKTNTQAWGFIVPKAYQQYWFYAGPNHNSVKTPKLEGGVIHNNGCCNWSYFMPSVHEDKAVA